MSSSKRKIDHEKQLRLSAEEKVRAGIAHSSQSLQKLSPEESAKVLHELWVHQIELEMQKEELFRTQGELELSRSRYFDLYNLAPVGYFTLNEDGLILESNLTATTLLGVPRQKLENRPISSFILPEDQDIFYHHRKKLFATGRPQVCELRLNRFNGEIVGKSFWARLESSVVAPYLQNTESDGNASPMFRVVLSDISEYLKMTAQLHQSQKMETVGLLAGGIAHDYNNKLAVIIGYAELALNHEIPAQTLRTFIEEILKAAQLSAAITRQLLTFARKQAIVPVVIDLNQVIEATLKMLRQIVGGEIELVWRPEVSLYPVKMDPVQIDQILANLCINARDAIADKGKVTIETRNAAFDAFFCSENAGYLEGEFVMLDFSDTGRGMTRDIVGQIFEPFFTTKEVGKGTGLGLATVEGIVKQNNGFINVYSEPGVGTTFRIYLPRHSGSIADRLMERKESMLPGCGETVLVVEDEPALLPMIKMMLEKLGYRVLAASSSAVAVQMARNCESKIHLLVTDVIMPEMNGSAMAAALQQLNPEMKTLFMSGYSANVLATRGVIAGNVNFIQKPFSIKELAEKVARATHSSAYINTGGGQQ